MIYRIVHRVTGEDIVANREAIGLIRYPTCEAGFYGSSGEDVGCHNNLVRWRYAPLDSRIPDGICTLSEIVHPLDGPPELPEWVIRYTFTEISQSEYETYEEMKVFPVITIRSLME